MHHANRVLDGVAYCVNCARRKLVKLPCPRCGKNVTRNPGQDAVLCRSCAVIGRKCSGCGNDLPNASLTRDEKSYCFNCTLKFRDPEPCAWCGKVTIYLTTSIPRGITERICTSCLSNHKKATCALCRKFRIIAGTDEKGRNICKRCNEHKIAGTTYVCPKCNKTGKRHSATECLSCYREGFFVKKIIEWSSGMKKAWVRSLALAWMEDYQSIHRHDFPYPSKDKIHGTMLFFNELDASCQSLEHLGLNYLFGTFGSNWTQQYRQAFDFLVRAGRIPPRDHQAYTDLNRVLIQLKYIEQAEGTWYKPLLTEFHTFMQEIREKYQQHGWNSDEKYQQESILTATRPASTRPCIKPALSSDHTFFDNVPYL
jgi:hypothetical protein